jgi:Protein of unknown function (DUF1360)
MTDPSARPPYESYAAIMAAFVGGLAGTGLLARAVGREARGTVLDLLTLSAATFKASRTVAHDEVTSFLRAPFVKGEAHSGEGEEPVQGGMEQAIGELVTCSRCVGVWTAAGLSALGVVAPRFSRLLNWSLTAAAVNDFLQAAFASLTAKANELEERTPG